MLKNLDWYYPPFSGNILNIEIYQWKMVGENFGLIKTAIIKLNIRKPLIYGIMEYSCKINPLINATNPSKNIMPELARTRLSSNTL